MCRRPTLTQGSRCDGCASVTFAHLQAALTNPQLARIMSWQTRRRVVVVLPAAVRCPWAGLGVTGCVGARCTAYIKGTYLTKMAVIYHELQHNFGLGHATRCARLEGGEVQLQLHHHADSHRCSSRFALR